MKRRILSALLALGVVAGYGSSFAQALHYHHAACSGWHHGYDEGLDHRSQGEPCPHG
jgi:hypothetical protein